MAKKVTTVVELVDDLDGGRADRTVSFGCDGISYEINLSKKNLAALEKLFKPYVAAARTKPAEAGPRTAPVPKRRRDPAAVRQWARANGYEISDHGRIPAAVLVAYETKYRLS